MKIADIVIDVVRGDSPSVWPRVNRFKGTEPAWGMFLRVVADDGTEGHRMVWAAPTMDKGYSRHRVYALASHILGLIKRELVGRDAADREWLWSQRYIYQWWGHIEHQSIAAVDEALWDLAGKLAGMPVYKLLGAARHKAPAYVSCPYLKEAERIADLCAQSKALGYPAFKIKPGGGPVCRIKAVTRLCREAVGGEMALMIDGQMQFDLAQALDIGRHLQDLDYTWWEDPVPHDRLDWYDELSRRLSIPIAYTDHRFVRFSEMAEVLRQHPGIRIVRGDTMRDGLTGLKKLCTLAEAYGRNCEIHAGSPGNLHVLMSVTNCDYWESTLHGLYDPATNKMGRHPEGHPFRVDEEGFIHALQTPGLGPFHDADRIAAERVERLA